MPIATTTAGMGSLFLCVDAGGTKTAAAIADHRGKIIARGKARSANMAEVGMERSATEIEAATLEAIEAIPAGVQAIEQLPMNGHAVCPINFAAIWIGIAGCDSPMDESRMTARLKPFFNAPLTVVNDGLLLSSPLIKRGCSWGICVVAGTGSVVVGVKVNGSKVSQLVRRGGQGHLLGDHGSAYHLGLTAVQYAADDFDFGLEREGGLAAKVRKYYGVESTADAPSRVHDLEPGLDAIAASNARKLRIAGLAPAVMASFTAAEPDPLSIRVVRKCARTLARDIAAVANQAMIRGCEPVCKAGLSVTGGVIKQEAYRKVLAEELAVLGVNFGWMELVEDAAGGGAVAIALSKAAS